MKNCSDFNKKWFKYLEHRHYGLAISDINVIEYLDKQFEILTNEYPDMLYSQIKLKFNRCYIYIENVPINIITEMEKHINILIK